MTCFLHHEHISFGAKSRETLWDFLKQTCLTRCDISLTRCLKKTFSICFRPKHFPHLFKHQIHKISFQNHVITISTNQITPNSQIFWENVRLHEKYFHLNLAHLFTTALLKRMTTATLTMDIVDWKKMHCFSCILNFYQNNRNGGKSYQDAILSNLN